MPDTTIRWATAEDWPVIWPWVRGAHLLPQWVTTENPTTLVAEREGALVAALSVTWGPWGYGCIDWVVTCGHRGRGAGRQLVTAAMAVLEALGMQGVIGVVRADMARVLAFDKSFGAQQHEGYCMFTRPLGGRADGEKH